MTPIDWTRDWSKASTEDIADAVAAMANSLGEVEQSILTEASELLWQLADWEKSAAAPHTTKEMALL